MLKQYGHYSFRSRSEFFFSTYTNPHFLDLHICWDKDWIFQFLKNVISNHKAIQAFLFRRYKAIFLTFLASLFFLEDETLLVFHFYWKLLLLILSFAVLFFINLAENWPSHLTCIPFLATSKEKYTIHFYYEVLL